MSKKYPFKRDFYEDVVGSIKKNKATFVLGPRKCGKTVCLLQVRDACGSAEYVDFKGKTEQKSMEVLSRIQKSIEKDEGKVYLLDEITYAPNPEKYICEIAYLFTENNSRNTRVAFSGSQSLALDKWGHIAFCGSAGFIRADFLSYAEYLRYKNVEKPSEESYERFLYETPEFLGFDSMREYLQGCLDETALSNLKTSNYLYGNDCDLLDADILLEVCYATLFTLHNHVTSTTFAKGDYLKTDIGFYFGKVCEELDLDKRIQDSFVGKYKSFRKRDWQTLEQAFLFLRNCGLITVTPVVGDLENIPDMERDFKLIAHGGDTRTHFKNGLFRDFNMCISYPAFYVAILRDILKERMPDRLPNGLLGSIVECHIRGMLPERFSAEFHDYNDNEIDYVNTVDQTAIEITVSNKPTSKTHFDLLPEDYRKILLTKDRDDNVQGVRRIPYYEFLASGADYNAYTKGSVVQSTEHAFEQHEEERGARSVKHNTDTDQSAGLCSGNESIASFLNACANDSLGMSEDDAGTAADEMTEEPEVGIDLESP